MTDNNKITINQKCEKIIEMAKEIRRKAYADKPYEASDILTFLKWTLDDIKDILNEEMDD